MNAKAVFKSVPGLVPLVRFLRGQPLKTPREYLLSQIPRRSVGVEIGVHEGDFSEALIRQTDPEHLHLVDPWKHEKEVKYQNSWFGGKGEEGQYIMDRRYESVKKRFASEIRKGQVSIHRSPSSEAAEFFSEGSVDWVYIDGNHLYEYVKKDLELFYPKVRPKGLILGDDYGVQGWWDNGVQKAVDEFAQSHPHLSLEVRDDQFILRE